jgi:ribosomal protein S18 acetylase RimI-like enzyme
MERQGYRMGVTVREAKLPDIKAIMEIARKDVDHLGFEPQGAYIEGINTAKVLVAILDDKYIIGFVKFGGTTKDMWTIYQIATARPARGKGAGKALIEGLAERAGVQQAGIRLKVTTENSVAVAFYQKMGFRIIDTERPNKRSLYVMEKAWQA